MTSATASTPEVIDLVLSDDDDDDDEVTTKKRPCDAINDESRRVQAKTIQKSGTLDSCIVVALGGDEPTSHDDDDDVQIVNGGGATVTTLLHANTKNSANENDEICIVGSTGPNALEDFPHSRESCVKHSFSENPLLFCTHCYCFVCDQEASKCPYWSQHCHATYEQPRWRRMRQEWKLKKTGSSSVPVPPAAAASVRPPPPVSTSNQAYLQRINMLTSYIQGQNTVFHQNGLFSASATSARERANMLTSYIQGQNTAFHQNGLFSASATSVRERATSTRATRRGQRRPAPRPAVASRIGAHAPPIPPAGGVALLPTPLPPLYHKAHKASQEQCIKDLLDSVAMHPSIPACNLVQPPSAQVFTTSLRHHQLESLTCMKNIEQEVTNPSMVTGGWLSDEGDKIATTLALVALNPMPCPPTSEQVTRFSKINNKTPRLKVKCSVILTFDRSVWKSACQKHAPGLHVIADLHPMHLGREDIANADVIIAPSDSNWHDNIINNFEFHRVIADESQFFAKRHYQTARCIAGQRRWCLSSRPCSTSVFDLLSQITFISPTGRWKYDGELHMALGGFRTGTAIAFQTLVQVLAKCMVRHSKSQQRQQMQQGSQSSTLTCSTISTIYLNLSSVEQKAFGNAVGEAQRLNGFVETGGTMNEVQRALLFGINESTIARTKIPALVSELQAARLSEPALKVVVYSKFMSTHNACKAKLERLGYDVYHVNDSTDAGREETIQKFQSDSENPAVLTIQLSGSAFGFKPPTTKRVYLMEPFLDPAIEATVTGQEGTVVAKRFVYRYSTESKIAELHKQIAAGQVSLANDGSFLPPEAIQILTKGMARSNDAARETSRLLDV